MDKISVIFFLVFIACAVPLGSALKCYMCNTLMQGNLAACPEGKDYHSMDCGNMTTRCIKLDGSLQRQNLTSFAYQNATGQVRNCGKQDWIDMFLPANPDLKCHSVNVTTPKVSPHDQLAYTFTGEVCLCDGENCNSAAIPSFAFLPLVSGFVLLFLKNF